MVASFDAHWPQHVRLYVYREGFDGDVESHRVMWLDLLRGMPGPGGIQGAA